MQTAWQRGRPVQKRLPEHGYQDNPVADWLTIPWDEFLSGLKGTIDAVPQNLDPNECPESWLDYLAALSGFIGDYWNPSWSAEAKRALITAGLRWLWKERGTRKSIEFVLQTLLGEDKADIWTAGEFLAGVTMLPAELGEPEWKYFIRLSPEFPRDGIEFRTAVQINKLYGVAHCDSTVCYDAFYCGLSVTGDPTF